MRIRASAAGRGAIQSAKSHDFGGGGVRGGLGGATGLGGTFTATYALSGPLQDYYNPTVCCFETQDEAARKTLDVNNQPSINSNMEVGGYIVSTKKDLTDGGFGYTVDVGTVTQVEKTEPPDGQKKVGDWHTHADFSVRYDDGSIEATGNAQLDSFNSNHFSEPDKTETQMRQMDRIPCFKSYLGTPSGGYRVNDGNEDRHGEQVDSPF